jgi:hypothetical protein
MEDHREVGGTACVAGTPSIRRYEIVSNHRCDTVTPMDPRQIVILKAAKNRIVGNTPQEIAMLGSLVRDGYLKREDREPPFPGYPTPTTIYRITVFGLATLAAQESET